MMVVKVAVVADIIIAMAMMACRKVAK